MHGNGSPAPVPISQIAIVVHDIDEALERYHRVLSWGPWSVYEHKPPALHDTYLHGKPTAFTMIGAETHVGPIVVELLQPVDGPSIYKEWLAEHGEGLHHIAVMRPTADESEATRQQFLDEAGADVLMEGRIGDLIVTGSAVFDGVSPRENARFMLEATESARESQGGLPTNAGNRPPLSVGPVPKEER